MSDVKEARFVFERATKNTYRFAEDGPNPMIGVLYVQKSALGPVREDERLVVTLTRAR